MKQSDIFTLILVAGIGVLASYFLCNMLLGDPDEAKVEFKTVSSVISSSVANPDPEIFNIHAINPTVEVYVGQCEDIDQNGMLDVAELAACGRAEVDTVTVDSTVDELRGMLESDKCIVTIEGQTLCNEEKQAYLTGLLPPDSGV